MKNAGSSLNKQVTKYELLTQKIYHLEEKIDSNTERILSKINTLQWVGGLLLVGIFLPLAIALWRSVF